MPDLPLPINATDTLKLADWLEIYALLSPDGGSSRGDLEQVLKTSSALESDRATTTDEAIGEKCLEVFLELEYRAKSAGAAYPFKITGGRVDLKSSMDEFSGYVFCLCLSYYRWIPKGRRKADSNPWLLFEELCCIAAAEFIGGDVVRFGTSRGNSNRAKSAFKRIVNDMCVKIGEGGGFREQPTLDRKDDKIDLVAWREFEDKRPSKLIMFGQCAGGENWASKVDELQPDIFWSQWVIEGKISALMRSFYIPHRIDESKWVYYSRRTNLLFDRCRVAYWAFRASGSVSDPRYIAWSRSVLFASPSTSRASY